MTAAVPLVALDAADGSRTLVSPFGAHVVSWTTADGREQLYLSRRAVLDGSAAIRGGIPVIFPQFAGEGPLPKHGFARTAWWREVPVDVDVRARERQPAAGPLDGQPGGARRTSATFELTDSPESRTVWPHAFAARVTVTLVPGALEVVLAVENRGDQALSFTAALHTYLAMDDAFSAEIGGLAGLAYRDSITRAPGLQRERVLHVDGAVNRVYRGVPSRIEVKEGERRTIIESTGFPDAVVWNPGTEGEAALGDMPAGDAQSMLCVEPAAIERPVSVGPGARWEAVQRLVAQ